MAKEKEDKDAKAKGGKDAKGDAKHDKGGKPVALDAKPAKQDKAKEPKQAKPTAKEAAPTQPPRVRRRTRCPPGREHWRSEGNTLQSSVRRGRSCQHP